MSKYALSSEEDELEDPFADSGSDFIPSSESSSSESEFLQMSDVDVDDNNGDSDQEQELDNVIEIDEVMNVTAEKNLEIKWTNSDFMPKVFPFDNSNSGLQNRNLSCESIEVDFFMSLLSEDIMNVIAVETNRYALQKAAPKWKNVDVPELRCDYVYDTYEKIKHQGVLDPRSLTQHSGFWKDYVKKQIL